MVYYRLMALLAMLITRSIIAQDLFPKQLNGRFGYIDTLNQWVIPAQFEQAGYYTQKKAIASRNDSLFLVINKDMILYLPNLKNYKELNEGHYAVQDKNGRWAIADNRFQTLGKFLYSKITYRDSMYIVFQNQLMGMVDQNYREVLPCRYLTIERMGNGHFKVKSGAMESIYAYKDSMVLIMQDVCLKYSQLHPKIYQSTNKSQTKLIIFNLSGDSIYGCKKCSLSMSFGEYIFVQHKDGVKMLDVRTGELKKSLQNVSGVMIETRNPPFLFISSEGELHREGREKPVFHAADSIKAVTYVNGKYLFFKKTSKWGICDYNGNTIIPCTYEQLDLVNDSFVMAIGKINNDLYYMPLRKKVMSVQPGTYLSIDETSILAYTDNGTSKLYETNSGMDLTDSAEFISIQMIHAGKKISTISTGGLNPGNTNNTVNFNTSLCARWFFNREHFGLLGFKDGDTLIKPRFISVFALNDSLDIITLRCASVKLKFITGLGVCHANLLYAIINNRTARYVVNPRYHFIDTRQYTDTSLSVVRVLTKAGKYALMNKKDYSLVEDSECDYISDERQGYMRLFYQSKFFSSPDRSEKKSNKVPQYLTNINQFWNCGFIQIRGPGRQVFVLSSSVNIADKKGNLQWDNIHASNLSYADAGKYGNFICVDHKNMFGVMSAKKSLIIPHHYAAISRLVNDDRYFVLQSNNMKYGYVNSDGVELSEAVFTKVFDFRDDHAWCKYGDSMVLINKTGDITETGLPIVQVNDVSEGLTSYRMKKGWCLIDVEGSRVGSKLFKKLRPFLNGSAAAMQSNSWGMIDKDGEWILNPEFDAFQCENSNVVVFSNNNHYHFYNRQGIFLQKVKARGTLKPLGNIYFVMEQNGSGKIFYENGTAFRKRKYRQDIRYVHDTILMVTNHSLVIYNSAGKRIDRYGHHGGARAIDKGMLKFARNKQSETTVTLMVAESQRQLHKDVFNNSVKYVNLVKPVLNGPAKLLNLYLDECFRHNAFIYEYQFFSEKLYGLSDSLGNLLTKQTFRVLQYYGNGMFKASYINQNGEFVTGILNHYGLWVVEPKFNEIKPFHSGVAIYSKRSDFWIADGEGKLITNETLIDYTFQEGYYCLKTEDKMAWWHSQKGWLTAFSK